MSKLLNIENTKDLKILKRINWLILWDYFLIAILLRRFYIYRNKGFSAWLMVLKDYCKTSSLYRVLYKQ